MPSGFKALDEIFRMLAVVPSPLMVAPNVVPAPAMTRMNELGGHDAAGIDVPNVIDVLLFVKPVPTKSTPENPCVTPVIVLLFEPTHSKSSLTTASALPLARGKKKNV